MSWAITAVAGSTLLGMYSKSQERDAQQRQAKANAEANAYSNWTGVHNQVNVPTADPLMGAAQGAVGGLGMAQSLKKSGMLEDVKNTAADSASTDLNMQGLNPTLSSGPNYGIKTSMYDEGFTPNKMKKFGGY